MRRQPRLLAVAALALLLVAGCGGDPKPKSLPSPTPSPSPSASASASPPALPAQAKTRAGAIAFARTFIETVNYAGMAGDTGPLRALYIPFCTRCEALADGIDHTYAGGGSFKGGAWTPTSFRFYAIKNDVAFVDAFVDYAPQVWTQES